METSTALNPGRTIALGTSGTTANAGPFAAGTRALRLHAVVDTYVAFVNSSTGAAVTATSSLASNCMFLPAGLPEYVAYDPGKPYVAAIIASSTSTLYITEML